MKLPLMIQVTLLGLMERSSVGQWFHVNQLSVVQFVYITYRMQCCTPYTHAHTHTHTHSHTHNHTQTHTHIHTHTYTHTHTHTHIHTHIVAYTDIHTDIHTYTHTHTHTRAYSTGNAQKQALSPIHESWRFLWIVKAKKLFV